MSQMLATEIATEPNQMEAVENTHVAPQADEQTLVEALISEQEVQPTVDGAQRLNTTQQQPQIVVQVQNEALPPPPVPSSLTLWIALIVVAIVFAIGVIIALVRKNKRLPLTIHTEKDRTQPKHSLQWQIAARQTIGKREHQEDSLSYSDTQNPHHGILAMVADGVGGMSDGQVASGAAAKFMLTKFRQGDSSVEPSRRLLNLTTDAHREVLRINQEQSNKCGSTVVSVLIMDCDLFFTSIGDSRIYLYRDGGLIQLNREHVLGPQADEQLLLGLRETGDMPDAKRRKAITAYLGKEDLRLIDRNTHAIKLYPNDRVLLMSDGVFGTLPEAEIIAALQTNVTSAAENIISLVEAAQKAHQDNATVLIIGA